MKSTATTVPSYLKSLSPDQISIMKGIRKLINSNIKSGFQESMRWGMITWEVPLSKYPNTYNGEPLSYLALAAQKNGFSLYLMGCYSNQKDYEEFRKAYEASGKRMDIGKSCVRFKKLEDLPLSLIIQNVKKYSVKDFIALYEQTHPKN